MCSKLFILIIFVWIGIYTSEILRIFCTCWNAAKVHVHAPLFPARCCFSTRLSQSKWDQAEKIVNFIFYSARCRSKINIIVSADKEFVKCFIKERFSTWNLSNFEFVKIPNLLNFTRETCLNCNIFCNKLGIIDIQLIFLNKLSFFDIFKYKLTPFILEKQQHL